MSVDCRAVYVDVESLGRNEVKPSQTSPGGGQSKVPGGEETGERKNPHQRDQQSVGVFGFCHLGQPTNNSEEEEEEIIKLQLRCD